MHTISPNSQDTSEGTDMDGLQDSIHSSAKSHGSTQPRSGRQTGMKERYLLLDTSPAGNTVISAQSLSSDWQILSTSIFQAPTFGAEGAGGGLMLRIEGVSNTGDQLPGTSEGALLERNAKTESDGLLAVISDVIVRYQKDVNTLRKVLASYEDYANLQSKPHFGHDGPHDSHSDLIGPA